MTAVCGTQCTDRPRRITLRPIEPAPVARGSRRRHERHQQSGNNAGGNPGYLPGDPRYGLYGDALKDYYRKKAAQWAIYCWDKPGTADQRKALLAAQKAYVKGFGEREIGYGQFVSDDGSETLGTCYFMQLDDRAMADKFVAEEPLNKAGIYARVEIQRWSNSFLKRAADYKRKGLQQFLCTGPKTGTPEFFRQHLHAHESYFASPRRQLHLPRADPLRRRHREHRHGVVDRAEGPRRGRQVLGRGAVLEARRLQQGCADCAVGVWGLRGTAHSARPRESGDTRLSEREFVLRWVPACAGTNGERPEHFA